MLDEFLVTNHDAIVVSARARVAARTCPKPTDVPLYHGIPVFLAQLAHALRLARTTNLIDHEQIGVSAGHHGHDLLRRGLTIGQVVHDYGDVCQSITDLAVEQGAAITPAEFRTLNLCLDDAIAGAVTEYARQRERALSRDGTERLAVFASAMRNVLDAATLSFASLQTGRIAPGGSTALVLARSLLEMRALIDGSLAEVRLAAGTSRSDVLRVSDLVEDLEVGAFTQAQAKGLHFAVQSVDRSVMVRGDYPILMAALANLLRNAFAYTRRHTAVTLGVRITTDRVRFDVQDECGGLASTDLDVLVAQSDAGHGLAICMQTARAHEGALYVVDRPGNGCTFTLDLPRVFPAHDTDVPAPRPG
ncbi:MAG: HAMP domain-containing sensor histidine kinase [Polyangiales bacterium]